MLSIEESVKTIGGINFSVLSPSEVRKYSVVEVTAPETYDEDGMPVQGGLMDGRLGTLEPGQKCGTCGNTAARCPGHFGHIELAEPILHIMFIDEVNKLLVLTCRSCSRLLIPQSDIDGYHAALKERSIYTPNLSESIAKKILQKVKQDKQNKVCPHCSKPQYQKEFTKPTTFHELTEWGGATRLLPIAIRERFEKITDDDLVLLGYDPKSMRPEWFVLQVLAVPPVSVRPSITLESGIRSEDDLTHKIVDILRVNQRLRESKESGTPPLIVQDLVDLLQYHLTTFFDNEVSGIPQAHHRSGRPLKTISQRLKGKEGRFRGSLSGKRVDFSSRTVISPDPNIDISEVGVPFEIAKKLTIPEKVSLGNVESLKDLVRRGPVEHPGANYVIRPDGVKVRLDYVTDRNTLADMLAPGYVVERHLMDGDAVLFNRQPSLHRMSIMAHLVKVLPYRTFRLHPAVCPPYNADFDGDEMNLHVPQNEEARSEALTLMSVQDQMLSPRYGGPIIGAIRDFITAAYLLTKDDVYLSAEEFTNLAFVGGYTGPLPKPALEQPKQMYSGKQLFSLFLPEGFRYVMASRWSRGLKSGPQNDVVIKDGALISGVIDRASIGAEEPDSVLHRIAKDYGTEAARRFLNSILPVLKSFITRRGFSYRFDELELNKETKGSIRKFVDDVYEKVKGLIEEYEKGKLETTRGLSPEETLELHIVSELARARDRAGRTADGAFSLENSGVIMAKTGARGSALNIGQMTAILGQQSVRGRRIEKGYRGRALSHFRPGDPSPDSKGFVKSNYRDGLSPAEFFIHAMGGREGLVDTAVRTQQSGYMQRRLVNAMEHLKVEYDLSVRDPSGNIIQFLYGDDGIDPAKSDHGKAVSVGRLVETELMLREKGLKLDKKKISEFLEDYSSVLNKKLLEDLRDALSAKPISRNVAKRICEVVVQMQEKAKVEPGEAIGVVAAQSIGEPGTQMTLRTFHFAGVKERDVTLGLPRLIELLDARKRPSTPSMTVYLDRKHSGSNDLALDVAVKILFTKVSDLIQSTHVGFEGIKIVLDKDKMKGKRCKFEEVVEAIKTGKRKVVASKDGVTLTVSIDGAGLPVLILQRNRILNTRVKGIPGINRITVVKEGEEWLIQTSGLSQISGSNLPAVLGVDGVDKSRTTTNNIFEIATTLGIEAARNALVNEVMGTLDEQGLEVDIRHILLVADLMTAKGTFQQIGRHGVAGTKRSVLARAAFEITVPTIAEAAVKGEVEELKGVTENVIVGLPIPVGTGMIDLFVSERS